MKVRKRSVICLKKKPFVKRGVPIGAYISQPLGNFGLTMIDHYMKEALGLRGYFRYSDDTTGFAKTKGEARRQMKEFIFLTEALTGLVVKASLELSQLTKEREDGKSKKRRRKRQRGKGRKDA